MRSPSAFTKRIVDKGMGFIALHWGAGSKVFKKLMGTTACLITPMVRCRTQEKTLGDRARASHRPRLGDVIRGAADGNLLASPLIFPRRSTIVFISSWPSGEVCRSGCCFQRGRGRVFFFRPGHETYPIYYQSEVQQVIANAVRWAARSS